MNTDMIFIGIKGTVLALDRTTGTEIWRSELKGADLVNVWFDEETLLAAAQGELFCLDPATGQVRWRNPLKGLGWGLLTIAGNQWPVIMREKQRQDQRRKSAGGG